MSAGPEPPDRIGRFDVRREIGRGAMGIVYEAFDPTLHRRIALKTIALGFGANEAERTEFGERFLDEARAVASLTHPGLVTAHDAGRDEDSGALFMALEFLEGQTLADFASEKAPVEWRETIRIMASVARALHAAHALGIVHRDIKPANIMLLASGETKVMDFGIAKLQASYGHLTSTGQLLGTPLYMSPEQALGRLPDGHSDLFSLGVVSYHLLTGVKLFHADSVPRIVTKVAYEEGRPASEIVSGLPPGVDQVMSRLLAKSPDRRHANGQELADDAEDLLAGRSPRHAGGAASIGESTAVSATATTIRPPSPAEVTRVAATRPPTAAARHSTGFWKLAVVGVLVFVTGLLTARAVWQSGDPPEPPEVSADRTPGPANASSSGTGKPAPRATQPSAATASPTSRPTPTPAQETGLAKLRVDFEHHYKSGTITVFVDKKPVFTQSLAGEVKADVAGVTLRKGDVDSTLELPPGHHDIWVEVRWDKNRRSEGISGTFRSGRVKTLRIRIDRFVKNMSLEWK